MASKQAAAGSASTTQPAAAQVAADATKAITAAKAKGKPATKTTAPATKRKATAGQATNGSTTAAKLAGASRPHTISLLPIVEELNKTVLGKLMSVNQTRAFTKSFEAVWTNHLVEGDKLRITGCGTLAAKPSPARIGRNPATGEQIEIKAGYRVTFDAAKDLREQLAKRMETASA